MARLTEEVDMRRWTKGAALAAAVVLAAGVGAGAAWAGAGAGDGGQPPATGPSANRAKIVAPKAHDDLFVPITPCRIVDTRSAAAGKLAVGAAREITSRGSGAAFAAQGGKAGGCGIPTSAKAITFTVTAVDAGSGFLRVWPSDLVQPNATFMNYDSAFNVSNSGTVNLCGTSGLLCISDLKVRAYGSDTHVVIDVAGYYVAPMWANLTRGGSIVEASRVTNVIAFGTGAYEVEFDRDVSDCSYTAAIDFFDTSGGSVMTAVDPRAGNARAVFVQTYNTSGTKADEPFYLEVTC